MAAAEALQSPAQLLLLLFESLECQGQAGVESGDGGGTERCDIIFDQALHRITMD